MHGEHAVEIAQIGRELGQRVAPAELEPLQADDIARAVMFAVQQPPHMDVNEILIRPTAQPG